MRKNILIPKLRFPDYSDEWNSYELKELIRIIPRKFHLTKTLNDFRNIKIISYDDICTKLSSITSLENSENFPFINPRIDLTRVTDENYIKDGDLIIIDAPRNFGYSIKAIEVKEVNGERFLNGPRTLLVRDKKDVTIFGFKSFLFLAPPIKNTLRNIAMGAPVRAVNKNILLKLKVNIPSKNEQQNIVNFLTAVDKKISLLKEKQKIYLNFKKYLTEQLFSHELRFKGSHGHFKEWKTILLKDTDIEVSAGNNLGKYPRPYDFEVNEIPFIRVENIQNSKITSEKMLYIPESFHNTLPQGHLKKNDILITTEGEETGLIAYVTEDFENSNIDSEISLLRVNDKNINPKFLYYLFTTSYLKKQFLKYQIGYNFKRLSGHDIENLELLIPSYEEQMMITHFLEKIENKLELNQSQISKIKLFKDTLLQQMFI